MYQNQTRVSRHFRVVFGDFIYLSDDIFNSFVISLVVKYLKGWIFEWISKGAVFCKNWSHYSVYAEMLISLAVRSLSRGLKIDREKSRTLFFMVNAVARVLFYSINRIRWGRYRRSLRRILKVSFILLTRCIFTGLPGCTLTVRNNVVLIGPGNFNSR